MELTGADLLRTIAVLAVVYSHISFYLIDDLGSGWWLIDGVYAVFVEGLNLNQHLSFVGVAIFMTLTGAVITRSAMRHHPGRFLLDRVGRLLPAFWVAIAAAILLVRLGINGMFSGQPGISNTEAALSFVLGGFFLRPEVAVLGVTWTLVVQVFFYLYCVVMRPVLRSRPVVVPLVGAIVCALILLYNLYIPQPYTVPMLSKVAATLPTVFLGQLMYLGWARLADWRWLIVGVLAQFEVVRLASENRVYWAGDRYMWTIAVVTALVFVVGRYRGGPTRWAVVRWTATRSYAIYLVHTLILYRVYEHAVGPLGRTGAVIAFLVVTAAVSDVLYRWVEVPAARWLSERTRRIGREPRETTPTGTSERPDPAANLRPVDTSDRA
ncbi:acyltransferase family protein [Prescottella agglutinans]|uniref:Peptidoglycan/LPS O-acetylase OafA/YrhL n=1 Tax=Prescottella agglutinans TaxID=1644129 RepID=A0ABT6MD72_9NOCA|nr:acyltransferase [Prescottella agglutinans]MDH6282247.1 peptidoglycan/LPS O-acetylase OafA/YrhL [Prescottella agglutinans]